MWGRGKVSTTKMESSVAEVADSTVCIVCRDGSMEIRAEGGF